MSLSDLGCNLCEWLRLNLGNISMGLFADFEQLQFHSHLRMTLLQIMSEPSWIAH